MAHTVDNSVRNPAGRLRDDLALAERLVVNPQGEVERLLLLLDSIHEQFTVLEAEDVDLRPERGRWDGLLRKLESGPAKLVAAAGSGGMNALRQRHPPAEHFWWHLDEILARRRRRFFVRSASTIVALIVLLVGGYWLINTLFPPDPVAVFMVDTNAQLDRLIADQNWTDALAELDTAKATYPDEPELYIWEEAIAAKINDATRGAAAGEKAQTLMAENPVRYWIILADHRLRVDDVAGADASLAAALELDPGSAQGHFLLGEIAERRGDYAAAVDFFNQAYELALDTDNQLAAMARVRMANALQSIGQPDFASTPTP
ncbi:MAG: hypothetical protein KDD92_09740 [Caldilineaceae bacterium]|nr:hypothetical protein [Caldilineaceae bacterium]